jgi:hypothetical protein
MGSPLIPTRAERPGGLRFAIPAVVLLCLLVACRSEVPRGLERATRSVVRELAPAPGALALPVADASVRFAVIGDAGRGDRAQQEVAAQMLAWRQRFPFEFVLMLGDNIYDRHTPEDYEAKFARPYRALLDAGVTFHAAMGNHDDPGQVFHAPFNMGGERYYTFRKGERRLAGLAGAGVRFFALDSRSLDPAQLEWLRAQLADSGSAWKICFFHHPLYTPGRYQAGARALRLALERVLVAGDVDAVLTGHEHFYARLHPQHGIAYFISGAAGSLRRNDVRQTPQLARGFDTDYSFMLFEVSGNRMYFQAISRAGETVDAGLIEKPAARGPS